MCPAEPASGQIPSTLAIPEAKVDCHPGYHFISMYTLQVSRTKRQAEQNAHSGLKMHTATACPAQDSAIAGVGLVGVGQELGGNQIQLLGEYSVAI